jgi:hypothetical protein
MLGLLLACANAGAGAGASDSPGLLPPPAASFVGTVSVGTAVDAPHSILSQGKLTFAPFGSKATLGPSGFTADLAGDYLVAGPGQLQHYWRAVQLRRLRPIRRQACCAAFATVSTVQLLPAPRQRAPMSFAPTAGSWAGTGWRRLRPACRTTASWVCSWRRRRVLVSRLAPA